MINMEDEVVYPKIEPQNFEEEKLKLSDIANTIKKVEDLWTPEEPYPEEGKPIFLKKQFNIKDQSAKADGGKPEIRLVPWALVRAVAYIRMYGNAKYHAPYSYRNVEPERYVDAAGRHYGMMVDHWPDPLALDEESGLPHLWHLACNVAFLCEFYEKELMEAINGQKEMER